MTNQLVASRLPIEVLSDLDQIGQIEHTDRSTTVRRLLASAIKHWKLGHYADAYAHNRLSAARAAEMAGVPLWEMLEHLRINKVPAQYDFEELEADIETIRQKG